MGVCVCVCVCVCSLLSHLIQNYQFQTIHDSSLSLYQGTLILSVYIYIYIYVYLPICLLSLICMVDYVIHKPIKLSIAIAEQPVV